MGDQSLESFVIHEPSENFFVLIHPFHEKGFQQIFEQQLEFFTRIRNSYLPQVSVCHGGLDDLVEEQLVSIVEISAKPVIDDIDQPGKRHFLLTSNLRANGGWPVELLGSPFRQADCPLTDFLKTIIVQSNLVIELVGGAAPFFGSFDTRWRRKTYSFSKSES